MAQKALPCAVPRPRGRRRTCQGGKSTPHWSCPRPQLLLLALAARASEGTAPTGFHGTECELRSRICAAAVKALVVSEAELGRKPIAEELLLSARGRNGSCADAGLRTLRVSLDVPRCLREDWAEEQAEALRAFEGEAASRQPLTLCVPAVCVPAKDGHAWGWGQLLELYLAWQASGAVEANSPSEPSDAAQLKILAPLGPLWSHVKLLDCRLPAPADGCAVVEDSLELRPDPGVSGNAASGEGLICCDDGSVQCAPEQRRQWNWFLTEAVRVSSGVYTHEVDIPPVFRYSGRPEFETCPVAKLVLKLYHLSWAFATYHKDIERKLQLELLDGVFELIQRFRWADLVRTGWGVPVFSFMHELSVLFCGFGKIDSVEQDLCEWEKGLPPPDGKGALLQFHEEGGGSSMYQQISFVLSRVLDKQWHVTRFANSLDSAAQTPFTLLTEHLYLSGIKNEGCVPDSVLDDVQRLYRWYGARTTLHPDATEGVQRTWNAKYKGKHGELVVQNFGDLVRTAHLLWAELNFIGLCRTLSAEDSGIMGGGISFMVVGEEKVYAGLQLLWGLEPNASAGCAACEERHQWVRGGSSKHQRKVHALELCQGPTVFPLVAVNTDLGVFARVIGVALAEVPGQPRRLEWMLDFNDIIDIEVRVMNPSVDDYPDLCGYRWELHVADLVCTFGDGVQTLASVVPPVGSGNMHPGPPLFLACDIPDGFDFPALVSVKSTESFWKQETQFPLCRWKGEQVPLALCTRNWYDLAPVKSHLEDWLEYYERLGVRKIYLYDGDGTAESVLKNQTPGLIEYFPSFYTRGTVEWFERLEREKRWNFNHTLWFPKMGCSIAQSCHCILHARGRAKYLLMARALDKFFVSSTPDGGLLDRFVQSVDDLAASLLPKALGAVSIEVYDYWSPNACSPNCQEAHRMRAEHGLPATKDKFLHLINPAQAYGQGSHGIWIREGATLAELPRGQFWMAHYLRTFDRTAEVQATNPVKRWRIPLCAEGEVEGKGCSVLRPDDFAALTYKEVMKGPPPEKVQARRLSRGCEDTEWQQLKESLILLLLAHASSPGKAVSSSPPWFGLAPLQGAVWEGCPEAQAAYRLMLVLVYYPPAALEDWGFAEEAHLLSGPVDPGNSFHRILLWTMTRLAQLVCNRTLLTQALEDVEAHVPPPRTLDRPLDLPECDAPAASVRDGRLSQLLRRGPGYWETMFDAASGVVEEQVLWRPPPPKDVQRMCHEQEGEHFCALTTARPERGKAEGARRWRQLDARGDYVAVADAASLGSSASLSQAECGALCDATEGCHSFAHCPADFGRCWLFDVQLTSDAETKHHGYCRSYFYEAASANQTTLPDNWMAPVQGMVLVAWGLCGVSHTQVAADVAVDVLGASIRRAASGPIVEVGLFFENQRTWRANSSNQTLGCARCFETAPGANFFRLSCNGSAANVTGALGGPRPWTTTTVACAVRWSDLAEGAFELRLSEGSGAWARAVPVRLCREPAPVRKQLAVCTQPLFNLHQHPNVLSDWLVYHRDLLGVDGSIDVYDSDGSAAAQGLRGVRYFRRFQELIGSPWLEAATRLSNNYCTEPLQYVHCLYRHRTLGTQRVLFLHSPDEFLHSEPFRENAAKAALWGVPDSLWDDTGWFQLAARNFGGPEEGGGPAVSRFVHYDPISSDQGSFAALANPANTLSVHVHWARARRPDLYWWMADPSTLRVNHYLDLFAPRSARGEERYSAEDRSASWAAPRLRAESEAALQARVAAALAAWAGRDASPAAIEAHGRSRRGALEAAFSFLASGGAKLGLEAFSEAFDLAVHDRQGGEDLVLFVRILHAYGVRLESAAGAAEAFSLLDRDGSGDLDEAEFAEGLEARAVASEREALLRALAAPP